MTNCLEGNSLFSFLSFCPGCPVHTLSPSSWSDSWWTTWPGGFKQLHISSTLGLPQSDSIFRTWVLGSIFPRWQLESCWWDSTTSPPRWPPSWKSEVHRRHIDRNIIACSIEKYYEALFESILSSILCTATKRWRHIVNWNNCQLKWMYQCNDASNWGPIYVLTFLGCFSSRARSLCPHEIWEFYFIWAAPQPLRLIELGKFWKVGRVLEKLQSSSTSSSMNSRHIVQLTSGWGTLEC